MTRIGIFFLLISWTYGENCYLSDSELKELENAFIAAEDHTTRIGSNQDAIMCLGATRSGKRPEIGQGPTSKTTIPTKWTSNKLSGFSIFDAPGFDDNRGPVQDITNSFHLYLLMRKVKSLKFVLVIDFGDIERDITLPFFKLLRHFENFFGDKFAMFFSSISVVFTKVPSEIDETEVDIEMIKHLLNKKAIVIKSVSSANLNNFLDYIIKNSSHIALFRKAESNRIDSSYIGIKIFPAISNSDSVNRSVLQNIAPSVSTKSHVCMFQVKNKLTSISEFTNILESLLNLFISILSDWKHSNMTPNNNTIKKIKKIFYFQKLQTNSIKNEFDVYKIIEAFGKMDSKIENEIKKSSLLRKIKIFYFVSRLFKMDDFKQLHRSFENLRMILRKEIYKIYLSNFKEIIGKWMHGRSVGDKVKPKFFLLLGMIFFFFYINHNHISN
ncbi:uncharacterized protein LOC122498858 isoform X2 [Leptopilina heterotoma]|uniref:uncharacterized protein LOC122498858 isoform X2 n=1 Tax=Leptopilina heterotoma TaxID=63436 RepID=UPI001CA824B1|nr:uncharacterized protein LOC122498858 isoform X2 [Leptopilina heterotoma]